MISIIPSYGDLPKNIWVEPDRAETMWATGSYYGPTHLNPWSTTPDPFSQLMFETLFGFNSVTQQYVPCIGESYMWNNSGTELHIKLNPAATWSNGRQINATDVHRSYIMAANQTQWKTDFPLRFASYNIVNATGVSFNMKPGYEYSRRVMDWISTNIPILPWYEVYKEVNATYDKDRSGDLSLFTNDWWSPAFNDAWKVCSGPYAPVYRNAAQTTSLFQKRNDWWGIDADLYDDLWNWLYGGPKYVGHRKIDTNADSDAAFRAGQVDLHAGYYEEMWNDFNDNSFLKYAQGWFGQDVPYQLTLGSPLNVAFNHEYGYPLNLSWFREAMAWMINYDPIPAAAASGYTRRSEPTFLDSLSTVHAPYFNDSLADTYRRSYNVSKAAEILLANNCTGSIGNAWYLPPELSGGQIGPFTMICPSDWTDVRIFTELVCINFQEFGIPVIYEAVDADAVGGWKAWSDRWKDRDYTLGMSVGEPKVIEPPEVFFNGWRSYKDWNNNITGWNTNGSQRFEDLYMQLESEDDPVKYQYILDEIQRIFCEEIPEIPCFVNGYWYTFSEYYWEGWTTETNDYQQLITVWTNNHIPMKHRMVLNLISDYIIVDGDGIIGIDLFAFYISIIMLVSVISIYKLKHKINEKKN